MAEVHSTYQWKLSEPDTIMVNVDVSNTFINATVKINKNNVFAIIDGTYEVTLIDPIRTSNKSIKLTHTVDNPKICTGNGGSYSISLRFSGNITNNLSAYSYKEGSFIIQKGVTNNPNKYLYILNRPTIIENLTIDGKRITDTYVKGSAIPINEIQDLSTKDFNNVTINSEHRDIFYKLGDNNTNTINIETNTLSIPELTLVDLPESVNKPIIICKNRSINKGINLKTSDPNISNRHFGYVIDIKDNRSACYNSVLVRKETLNKIFPDMPENIMSTTQKFEYNEPFKFERLTYEVVNVDAPIYINNERKQFSPADQNRLKVFAPTYKKVIINESTNGPRNQKILLKNIEFVKFGDKVIKLNYKPLNEA